MLTRVFVISVRSLILMLAVSASVYAAPKTGSLPLSPVIQPTRNHLRH